MNCKQTKKWLSLAMDNELSAQKCERMEQHLAHCPECRALKEQWMSYGNILRQPANTPLNTDVLRADVLREIRTSRPDKEKLVIPGLLHSRPVYAFAMVAIVSVMIMAGLRMFSGRVQTVKIAERNTEVEWVETDIPGATAMVYEDEETGLTVIWVITEEDDEEHEQATS